MAKSKPTAATADPPGVAADERLDLTIDGYLDVKAAAEFSGICRSRLFAYMRTGKLAYAMGKNAPRVKRLVSKRSLRLLMAELLVSP
jgi:hypothetical protein